MKKTLRYGIIKRIHVNMHHIHANHKDGGKRPVFGIQTSQGVHYTNEINIENGSKLIWNEDKPLSCGARAWIETKGRVTFDESDIR